MLDAIHDDHLALHVGGEAVRAVILALSLLLAPSLVDGYAPRVQMDEYAPGAQMETSTNRWKFPWNPEAIVVDYLAGFPTFVYTTAHPYESSSFDGGLLFAYHEEGFEYGPEDIVVLDPSPPAGEGNTFLDLYFNESLRMQLRDYLWDVVGRHESVRGFVLGDEWPRGLSEKEVTIQDLSRYNHTYRDETGQWMRPDPSLDEKKALADWFYAHSIDVWDSLAWEIRHRFPAIYLGTNLDLAWEPDYNRSDVAHWKAADWWGDVDPAPYDFVVAHRYSGMVQTGYEDPSEVNYASVSRLRDALESLLNPASNPTSGKDVFIMLGAHCSYPRVITPMQMVEEWNTVLEFSKRLAGVGWFTFDLWTYGDSIVSRSITGQSPAPMREDRLLTMKWLGKLNRYGPCVELKFGSQISIHVEPGNITLVDGDEVELQFTVQSFGWEGDVSLQDIQWSPSMDVVLEYEFTDGTKQRPAYLGFLSSKDSISKTIRLRAHKQRYSRDPVIGHLVFLVTPSGCERSLTPLRLYSNRSCLSAVKVLWESPPESMSIEQIVSSGDGGYLLQGHIRTYTGENYSI